jgi:hypothetical protein
MNWPCWKSEDRQIVSGIPRMLFSLNKNAWKVYRGESYLWLKAIHRRLARGRNIRGPFFLQIRRDIPVEMFRCLVRTIKICWRPFFCDPNSYVVKSKKMTVVSFQSILGRRLRGISQWSLDKTVVLWNKGFCTDLPFKKRSICS